MALSLRKDNSLATSKVNIISLAITSLGHAPIVSLTDGDNMVVAAEQAYDLLLPASITHNNWRWAAKIEQLSQTSDTAPEPYKTVYNLPAGWLKTIRTYPNIYCWDIYNGSQIYAQIEGEWYMEYLYQPDATLLPESFVLYFIYEIAAYLALSNAQLMSYYDRIEIKRKEAFAVCAGTEAQNRPQFSQYEFPVISRRNLATFIPNSLST